MIHNEFFKKLTENHPFITVCSYSGQDYVGIIQNRDDVVTTIYDYGLIVEQELREKFLELGEIWWWESNRQLPVNLFIGPKFKRFSYCLRTYNVKDFELLHGEAVSLQNIITKRIKRRQIQLVQKL